MHRLFESTLQSGVIWKCRHILLAWKGENGAFRKQYCCWMMSTASCDLISRPPLCCPRFKTNMVGELLDMLLMLLTSLIACLELNIALFNRLLITFRRRISILRTLVLSNGLQCKTQASKPYQRPRGFWILLGQKSAWWDRFVSEVMIPEEWKENFRMSCTSVIKLAEEHCY